MFPPGFLGTRADILIDIVTLSFIIILPLLIWSWRLARVEKAYERHRNVQLALGISLAIVVGLFEYDLAQSGGIFALVAGSAWEGTAVLNTSIYVHTLFAVVASIVWVGLIIASLLRFSNPPQPNAFSRTHRVAGRIGMIAMIGAAITAPPLYYFGFIA
jgi:ABC-type enterochelin transport system permease subunit